MPDLGTRISELLRDAAHVARPDDRLQRQVLRRALRRRILNASGMGLLAIALVAGAFLGAGELGRPDRTVPADESPSPGTVAGRALEAIWPETTSDALAEAQARADGGELAWRLDPEQTASAFATEVLGWDPADVRAVETGRPRIGTAFVTISNLGLGPGADSTTPVAPETVVTLQQRGDEGAGGVWSVTRVDSDRIELQRLPEAVPTGGPLEIAATFGEVNAEWFATFGILVVGPSGPRSVYTSRNVTERFVETIHIPFDAVGTIGVVVALVDPEGTTTAADIVPVAVEPNVPDAPTRTTGSGRPTDAPAAQIPSAVLATRDAIAIAAETRDYEALEALIDPDRFHYNFRVGGHPVPGWRKDPAVLDTLLAILQMPPMAHTITDPLLDGAGVTYMWPALIAADLTDPTAEERAMLETLGITERDVRQMLDAFGGYVGPRTGIAEDGTWLFYASGRD
jgi:hypothetical protein